MQKRWWVFIGILVALAIIISIIPSTPFGAIVGLNPKTTTDTSLSEPALEEIEEELFLDDLEPLFTVTNKPSESFVTNYGLPVPTCPATDPQTGMPLFVDGEFIITFEETVSLSEQKSVLESFSTVKNTKHLADTNTYPLTSEKAGTIVLPSLNNVAKISFDSEKTSSEQAILLFSEDSRIKHVMPNYCVYLFETFPNDPEFDQLWGLHNTGQTNGTPDADIDAPEAWDLGTGTNQVIVAVIDTGIDYTHPDLASHTWVNVNEISENGIDDDNNGYIDDVRGWDFINGDNDPADDHFHGTHVSGTIGAIGNNAEGVAGVNWNVQIMPLKICGGDGGCTVSGGMEAAQYATLMGAQVMSNSWGGFGGNFTNFQDIITDAYNAGVLYVAAAGNSNDDVHNYFPASYDHVITVGATNHNDQRASFSNFGNGIDVVAPGVNIYSTWYPGHGYFAISGTSMATPHVSGLAALMISRNPSLTPLAIQTILENSADDIGDIGEDDIFGYGRINAHNALLLAGEEDFEVPDLSISSPNSGDTFFEPIDIIGTANSETFVNYTVEYASPGANEWILAAQSDQPAIDELLAAIVPDPSWQDGVLSIRLTVTLQNGNSFSTAAAPYFLTSAIYTPLPYDEFFTNDQLVVTGLAGGPGFDGYTLSYQQGDVFEELDPDAWITFASSTEPVLEDVLGTLILTEDIDSYTVIRLETSFSDGSLIKESLIPVYSEVLQPAGWPQHLNNSIPMTSHEVGFSQSPVVLPGDTPLIFAPFTFEGLVDILTERFIRIESYDSEGNQRANFPPYRDPYLRRLSTPAVADFNNDGNYELIFTASTTGLDEQGEPILDEIGRALFEFRLIVLSEDGDVIFENIISDIDRQNIFSASTEKLIPLIVDIDNDNSLDIIVGGGTQTEAHIYAFNKFGESLPNFPIVIPDVVNHSTGWARQITAADVNQDGSEELFFWIHNKSDDYKYFLAYNSEGQPFENWEPIQSAFPHSVGTLFSPKTVAGDITGDGFLEIITYNLGGFTRAYDHTGTLLPSWSDVTTGAQNGLSLGDITGDGIPEVVALSLSRITVLDGEGDVLPGWPFFPPGSNVIGAPIIVDITGDGSPEILFDTLVRVSSSNRGWPPTAPSIVETQRVYALDQQGNIVDGFPRQLSLPSRGSSTIIEGSLTSADINQDGFLDIVAGSKHSVSFFPDGSFFPERGRIKIWETQSPYETAVQWGSSRSDHRNLGTYAPGCSAISEAIPAVTLLSPSDGETLTGLVNVSITVDHDQPISSVSLFADGTLIGTDQTSAYLFILNSGGLDDGTHTLTVEAEDCAGIIGTTSITVQTQNTPPSVSITSPEDDATISSPSFQILSDISAAPGETIQLVELIIDDLSVYDSLTEEPYEFSIGVGDIGSGTHTLTVRATDQDDAFAEDTVTVFVEDVHNRVFFTSQTFDGNVGGIKGADASCRVAAENAQLGGVWKAWISNDTTNAAERIDNSAAPYKLLDGTVIADNWEDLTDGFLRDQGSIAIDEFGTFNPTGGRSITGTDYNGFSTGINCDNWHSNSDTLYATAGTSLPFSELSYGSWTNDTTILDDVACDFILFHLYCIEQILVTGECADGVDNDNDQLIDENDPGCWADPLNPDTYNPELTDESAATTQCQDGIDNDNDGFIDYPQDPECVDAFDNQEEGSSAPFRVFVTSEEFAATELGGLLGADAKCQAAAETAQISGVWKAWISNSTTNAADRLTHADTPYTLIDGTIIADNWEDLTDGTLNHAIDLTETGETITNQAHKTWTGTNTDGSVYQDKHCADWNDLAQTALLGKVLNADVGWTLHSINPCTSQERLYCFSEPLPVTPECSDDIDNDGDNVLDENDPGCWTDPADEDTYDPNLTDESTATTQCQDGIDNDGDGDIDYPADEGCDSPEDNQELGGGPAQVCGNNIIEGNEECDDGNNENGDGCSASCRIEEPTRGPSTEPTPPPIDTGTKPPQLSPGEEQTIIDRIITFFRNLF